MGNPALFTNISEYVKPEFIDATNKKQFIEKDRIICQQISNINCEKRLKFAFCSANHILGNSCNFISISENNPCITRQVQPQNTDRSPSMTGG